MKFNSKYSNEEINVSLHRSKYSNGGHALSLIDESDGFPYAKCTVNIPGLSEDEVAIKDYSENEGVYDLLVDNGIIERSHRTEYSGFVALPICKIK
jgi:hypothetical protein